MPKTSEYIRLYGNKLNLHGAEHKEELKVQKQEKQEKIQLKIKEDLEKKISIFRENNTPILCECGCETLKRCLKTHQKTKKHLDIMEKEDDFKSTDYIIGELIYKLEEDCITKNKLVWLYIQN